MCKFEIIFNNWALFKTCAQTAQVIWSCLAPNILYMLGSVYTIQSTIIQTSHDFMYLFSFITYCTLVWVIPHPTPRATHPGGGNLGLWVHFLYMIAEVFIYKISSGHKSYSLGAGWGVTKVGRSIFSAVFSKTSIADSTWIINIFFKNKLQIICKVFVTKITYSHICVFPSHHPQISRDFDSFSNFLEKQKTSFRSIV